MTANNQNKNRFITTLANGMKAAVVQSTGNVAYAGILVNAGSREDPEHLAGQAHFLEHTIFKGTERRSSWHISNRMESVGGELNAYTFKEGTSVYTIAPAGYEERSLELISDLIKNAVFPAGELDREREVIIEEIFSYRDTPSESVFDCFEEYIYADSALSHNILGTEESVRRIGGSDCRAFMDKYYNPANMVAFVSSPANPSRVVRLLEKHLGTLKRGGFVPERTGLPSYRAFDEVCDRSGHQAHTLFGTRIFGRQDPRRFPLFLIGNYLAGPGMNSLLNRELREKRGLVYTVESITNLLSDTGTFSIYFGTDRKHVDKCLKIIRNELESLATTAVSERKLSQIKDQYCGQLLVSSDNSESMAMSLGKNLLFFNKLTDVPALASRIREVSAEEIRSVAEMLVSSGMSRFTLM